jgi:phospholipase C
MVASGDHVSPPVADRWGPGLRVPTLIISPFARRGFVDHTFYDTTSILKMIETRFDVEGDLVLYRFWNGH